MNLLNTFLFIVLPYIAITVFLIGTIYRYKNTKFKFSSLSSQFLESRNLFWGSVPFHWGIMVLFFGHLIALLLPETILSWNSNSTRLLILEVSAFIFGLSAFIGMFNLLLRRNFNSRINVVTSKMDLFIEVLLFIQLFFGLLVAFGYRWGSSWFALIMSPYLNSLFTLNPQIAAISSMPWVIKTHVVLAYTIVLLFPFTRLVHLLVFPLSYVWRPYHKVIWNWNRKKIRDPNALLNISEPKNN